MVTKKQKEELIYEYSIKVQNIVHELEGKMNDKVRSCVVYYGDLDPSDHTKGGTKIDLSVIPDNEPIEFGETISDMTVQDIIISYHNFELEIKRLMDASVGLDFITDKYLEIIELEKKEARKSLGSDNEEYFKLL